MDATVKSETLEDLIEGSVEDLEIDSTVTEWETTQAPMAIGTAVGTFVIHC